MGGRWNLIIYPYWRRGRRTHCRVFVYKWICMWLFLIYERQLVIGKHSSNNWLLRLWNITPWYDWILGDKYGNPTVWKMRSRESVWNGIWTTAQFVLQSWNPIQKTDGALSQSKRSSTFEKHCFILGGYSWNCQSYTPEFKEVTVFFNIYRKRSWNISRPFLFIIPYFVFKIKISIEI